MQMLKSIIAKISLIEDDILLVIDNAEDLIKIDRPNFRKLIAYLLQRVRSMKVLLTSRVLLYSAAEFKEETTKLPGLNERQTMKLFFDSTRKVEQDEKNRLLDIKPDPKDYPNECNWSNKLHDHHFFRLFNGNP